LEGGEKFVREGELLHLGPTINDGGKSVLISVCSLVHPKRKEKKKKRIINIDLAILPSHDMEKLNVFTHSLLGATI